MRTVYVSGTMLNALHILFAPPDNVLMGWLPPFYRWGTGGLGWLAVIPKVALLSQSGAELKLACTPLDSRDCAFSFSRYYLPCHLCNGQSSPPLPHWGVTQTGSVPCASHSPFHTLFGWHGVGVGSFLSAFKYNTSQSFGLSHQL